MSEFQNRYNVLKVTRH